MSRADHAGSTSLLLRTVPDMTDATPSTQQKSPASLGGGRLRNLKADWVKPWRGTLIIAPGFRASVLALTETGFGRTTRRGFHNEGNYSCRRIGNPALPRDTGSLKAAPAGV